MIHTLTISHRILSPKVFYEIYKGLERRSGEKPKKIDKWRYETRVLRDIGFTEITLTNKKIDSKYRYNFMQITIRLNPLKLLRRNKLEV